LQSEDFSQTLVNVDTRAFLLGLFTATLLCAGAYYYYLRPAEPDPCHTCSTGTRCAAGLCVAANAPVQPVTRRRPGQRFRPTASSGSSGSSGLSAGSQGSTDVAGDHAADRSGDRAGSSSPDTTAPAEVEAQPAPPPPPPPLRPEERKLITVGDKLTGTEIVNLAESGEATTRELSQEDLDAVFRPRQPAIVGCIDDARGEAQLDAIITVAFRVRRTGEVAGVRVEAPSYLIAHGLNDCVRRIVLPLRFPASAKAQIVTYPFSLH
jgi:hypothetical protein